MTGNRSRLDRLEAIVERQRDTIERQRARIDQQQTTIDEQRELTGRLHERLESLERTVESESPTRPSLSRRGAIQAGGLIGLLGLGATTGSATPSGQIGTESRPLETLHTETLDSESVESTAVETTTIHTAEINGDIVKGDPITGFDTSAQSGTVPVRDDGGRLAVGDATDADHAVTRGQDVDWSGQHEHQDMPTVDGSAIVESGSDSDGEWVRFADGTQIARGTVTASMVGGGQIRGWFDFPRTFTETPTTVSSQDLSGSNHSANSWQVIPGQVQADTSSAQVRLRSPEADFNSGDTADLTCIAIGRWQ